MKWNKSNRHKLYLVPFAFPAFFPFLLSFFILMSTTAFYRGMVPVWYITGRTHTGEWGQDSSRVRVMLAERLRVLKQACWFRVWAKEHHHAQRNGSGPHSLLDRKIHEHLTCKNWDQWSESNGLLHRCNLNRHTNHKYILHILALNGCVIYFVQCLTHLLDCTYSKVYAPAALNETITTATEEVMVFWAFVCMHAFMHGCVAFGF